MSGLDGFTATGRTGAVDQVIAYVRYAVKNGTYNVGDKLPNESELAATIGVGRSSLREGMRILATYGIVEIRQGDGTYIIDKTVERFLDFLGYIPSSNLQDFIDLRRVIEVGTITVACGKLTEKDFQDLENLNSRLDYQNGLDICVQADRDFHIKLMSIVRNPLILQIEKMIYQTRSELLYKLMCYPDVAQDAHTDQEKIIEALRGGQVYECVEAVMAHLNDVSQNIERLGINPAHQHEI